MTLPYYKRFPRDFLEGTIGLSFEEKGAYAIVLDLIYMRGGRLEDDVRYVSGQLNCSVRLWKSLRDALVSRGKISVVDGFIINSRAEKEIENVSKYQEKQAENRTNPNKDNALKPPKPDHLRDYPEPYPEPEEKVAKATQNLAPVVLVGEVVSSFDDFWRAYPHKVGKPAAKTAFDRALKRTEPGRPPPTPADILAGLARYIRGKPADRAWLNPATFLNQERFYDEPSNDLQPRTGQTGAVSAYLGAVAATAQRGRQGFG